MATRKSRAPKKSAAKPRKRRVAKKRTAKKSAPKRRTKVRFPADREEAMDLHKLEDLYGFITDAYQSALMSVGGRWRDEKSDWLGTQTHKTKSQWAKEARDCLRECGAPVSGRLSGEDLILAVIDEAEIVGVNHVTGNPITFEEDEFEEDEFEDEEDEFED